MDFDFKKNCPSLCTRHLFDFVRRREWANSKESFIFKSAYFVSKIQPLDNNDFISNNEQKCNIELRSIQCKKNHKSTCSQSASKLNGVFAGGEGLGEGKKLSLPSFLPRPLQSSSPSLRAASSRRRKSGQSISINQYLCFVQGCTRFYTVPW